MKDTWQKVRPVSGRGGQPYNLFGSCVNYINVLCMCIWICEFYCINMCIVTNEIKPHPLTADTYSNQRMLLTLNVSATTISLTDHAQSFSPAYFYHSAAIVIKHNHC